MTNAEAIAIYSFVVGLILAILGHAAIGITLMGVTGALGILIEE
ncbi:hypothetical protein [Ligilactobacillus agilis]|nr:hypothetical protein [Ligilactobacillus agilis]